MQILKTKGSNKGLQSLNFSAIDIIRLNDLRHTCASLLLAKNISMKYIQHQLGHTTIKTTMDIYTHLMPSVYNSSIDELDNVLKQTTALKSAK